MRIINIINEELLNLNEGLSDIVYHYTHVGNIINILATNKLNTSSNLGTKADAIKDMGRVFYFSTQRTKGKSGYGKGKDSVLVLDGRKLMSRYKGFPMDYWNWSMNPKDYSDKSGYMQALQSKENEDRIVTDKPYIEPATDYIREIHVDLSRPWYIKKSEAQKLEHQAKSMGIEIYFYDDKNQYQLQNKAKSKPVEQIDKEFMEESQERYVSKSNHFRWIFEALAPYIFYNTKYESEFWQLYMKYLKSIGKEEYFNDFKTEIDEKAMQVYKFYKQENYKHWYHMESNYRSLMADIHNAKSSADVYYREFLKLLIKDMKDFKATDLKQYFVNKLGLKTE